MSKYVMPLGEMTIEQFIQQLEKFPQSLKIRWDGCCERRMQLDSLKIEDGSHLVFDFYAPIG